MLILSRKKGETVHIGDNVTVTVLESRGNRVWIGLDAPKSVRILRHEVLERDCEEPTTTVAAALSSSNGNRLTACS